MAEGAPDDVLRGGDPEKVPAAFLQELLQAPQRPLSFPDLWERRDELGEVMCRWLILRMRRYPPSEWRILSADLAAIINNYLADPGTGLIPGAMWHGAPCGAERGTVLLPGDMAEPWWCWSQRGQRVPCVWVRCHAATFDQFYLCDRGWRATTKLRDHQGNPHVHHQCFPVSSSEFSTLTS